MFLFAMTHPDDQWLGVLILAGLAALLYFRLAPKWRPSSTAFGTAQWATDEMLKERGMLSGEGLVLARTFSGHLITLPRYTHLLLVGRSGGGKGVSIVTPNILHYDRSRGSLVMFDPKGELLAATRARLEAKGFRVRSVAPFDGGEDRINPLDCIPADSTMLIDSAGALAESLIVRGGSKEPFWDDKSSQIVKAILCFVLTHLKKEERNLNTVQDIASNHAVLLAVAGRLAEKGGIAERMSGHIKGLFDRDGVPTREGASVLSVVARHLAFLDSEMAGASLKESTFAVRKLLEPGTALFLRIPPNQLEAQKGLLRCWISTIIREIGMHGNETKSEVLLILDEAEALSGLQAVQEMLVRGRSGGARSILAFQASSQVEAFFEDKKTLLYDNTDTQIWLKPTSLEGAERLSKMLGEWTQVVEGYSSNDGTNYSRTSGSGSSSSTVGGSSGASLNYSVQARPLRKTEELLTMSPDEILVFNSDLPAPILGRRIKFYEDPAFTKGARPARPRWNLRRVMWWALAAAAALLAMLAWAAAQEPADPFN